MDPFKDLIKTPIAALQAAAMPELYSSMPSSPQTHVLYLAPGHDIISPEKFRASNSEKLVTGSGPGLAKMSPSMLVKYGSHASLIEAKNMLYVAEKTSIPVPKLYAADAYGPLERDVGDHGSVYDTYIFMEYIEGEDLGKSWKYMTELRSLPPADYIGSVHRGLVTDLMLERFTTSRGPFKSVQDFNTTIIDTFIAKSKGQVGPFIRGMVNAHKHGIVFTHGDLRLDNIIVKHGRVVAIIDWEMSGWYPEYWEFAKVFYIEYFKDDWASHLLDVLTPYYCEQLMYERLMSVLW